MNLKKFINKLFFEDEQGLVNDAQVKHLPDGNLINAAQTVYGRKSIVEDDTDFYIHCKDTKRFKYMCKNMDELLDKVKEEITVQPLLARVIRNISKGVLKNGYKFECSDQRDIKREKKIKKYFDKILTDSGYEENEFLQEILINLIKYSNAFLKPIRDEKTKKIIGVLNMQNKGFTVNKAVGTGIATEYKFENKVLRISGLYENNSTVKYFKSPYEIWHCAFGKETDEIFGMPIWVSVIPVIKKYNYLISSSIDSYSDQSIERTIYRIGLTKNGQVKPVTPEAYRNLKNQLEDSLDDDIITDIPVDPVTITKTYTSPDKLLDVLSIQVIAGLFTSESQLGKSGAGRQDAETQQSNTDGIVLEFQKALENFLNKTIIKELSLDLFGNSYSENPVKIKFVQPFNESERLEKHAVYKFQAGVIDLDETRELCNHTKPINPNKTNHKLYSSSEVDGQVQNTNSPSNQYTGPTGTGTTKKSSRQ